jgi:hypothetical protein
MGQFNAWGYDQKFSGAPVHFGITMGFNRADFRVFHSDLFINNDTISVAEAVKAPGFHLGIISNMHLTRSLDFRFLPSMSFAERRLYYETFQDSAAVEQSIESINVELPLLLKYKSEPWKDMRAYVLAGVKYNFDLASNAKARNADDLVKLGRHDISLEYGVGIEIYFPYFIFAPEIRMSQGIFDVLSPDPGLKFSNVFEKLLSRMFTVSFHFEG